MELKKAQSELVMMQGLGKLKQSMMEMKEKEILRMKESIKEMKEQFEGLRKDGGE